MRIAIIGSYFPPWRGGVETYLYNLSRHLQRRGHQVSVICGDLPAETGVEWIEGIKVERLRVLGRIYGTPVIPKLLWTLADEEADIMHANFPGPYAASLASVVSRFRGIPAVLTWHNDLPPVTSVANLLALAHDRVVLPLYLPHFRFIIATSQAYAETSQVLSVRPGSVVVVPNGVDVRRFNPGLHGDQVRARLRLGDSKIVLFVGALNRWHAYKGLDMLIEAMALVRKECPKCKLLIVGGGELAAKYHRLALELGVGDYVLFAGDIADEELPSYYACCDVLVLPSKDRSEGFGLTILEANATGKPVIGSSVGGIPSVISDGYNGLLVPPNDPRALAAAMTKLLEDEDLRLSMGRNGRRVAQRHDWSIVAEQTERVYERAIAMQ